MKKEQIPEINLYSDGGANPNPGKAGFGCILEYKGIKKEFSQGYTLSTNNRMELMGVIFGLSQINKKSKINIYTDSQYTINGIQKGWAEKWKNNHWMRTNKEKAINYDLWEVLLEEVSKHEVIFHWVKGHNGHIENERCDELATLAMDGKNIKKDVFYITEYSSKNNKQGLLKSNKGENETKSQIITLLGKGDKNIKIEKEGDPCKKCGNPVIKKIPKHTKKTLQKKFYYKYYFTCDYCKTNYMTNSAKDNIKNLKI